MALDPYQTASSDMAGPSSIVAALSVYVEPLVADARVAVLGDGELGLYARLHELGARTVHLYDPDPDRVARLAEVVPRGVSVRTLRDDLDVREGAFDLVVIPDVGALPDPSGAIGRMRRVVDSRGAVVAMGRARTTARADSIFPELAPAAVEYAELYDLFALQFESVTMTGVLPFRGVVFAQLGTSDDLTVSVDTRLVEPEPPGVFVVVASREEEPALDPYAIVQIARRQIAARSSRHDRQDRQDRRDVPAQAAPITVAIRTTDAAHEAAAAFAAMHLKAEMLSQQLDEHRDRLASGDQRAAELERILAAAQHAQATLERRLVTAEEGMLERDDQIAALNAELDQQSNLGEDEPSADSLDPAMAVDVLVRAERAEVALARHIAEFAQAIEAHAAETASTEARLRERAAVISSMENELAHREQLVRELVASLEEARDNTGAPVTFEAAPAAPGVAPEDVVRLRRKLDALALEVARREGELAAQAWRITELENDKRELVASARAAAPLRQPPPTPPLVVEPASATRPGEVERELAAARDELDALRQALTQEHAARVAAESGEELARARAELARQGAVLEQMRVTHPEG